MPGGLQRGNGVDISVPRGLLEAESLVKGQRRAFVRTVGEEIRDKAREYLGDSTHIGPSLRVRSITGESAEIYSTHPGARAQNTGAFIQPKKGSVLKFTDRKSGEQVFTRKPVRIKGKRYLSNALAPRNKQAAIERAFARVYGPVLKEMERV